MSQKPGQAPHIFTPNTAPTVEADPVGASEAVATAGQTAIESSTPPAPETQRPQKLVGSGNLHSNLNTQTVNEGHAERARRRKEVGIGDCRAIVKHANLFNDLGQILRIGDKMEPQYPIHRPMERSRLRNTVRDMVTLGKVDPSELLDDLAKGGLSATAMKNLGPIVAGLEDGGVHITELAEPLAKLAAEHLESQPYHDILQNIGIFIRAGAPMDFANLTSQGFGSNEVMPLLENLEELSALGVNTEDIKRRAGEELNSYLKLGVSLDLFATPSRLKTIEASLKITIGRQDLGQKIIDAMGDFLEDRHLEALENIGVDTSALKFRPKASAE